MRMFNSDLNLLGVAIISFGALSFSTVSAQTLLFQDDFAAENTTQVDLISDPSIRGSGSLQDDIDYQVWVGTTEFNGVSFGAPPELRIHNNALDFSAGIEVGSNGQITSTAPYDDRYVRFEASDGTEFNWGPGLGKHYEISFQMHATFNSPLAFSISDTVTPGFYRPDSQPAYDFGLSTWTGTWRIGEDGNKVESEVDQGLGVATAGGSYDVRVVIDERNPEATTASVFIDGSASALHTFDIDFENDNRYFQFTGRKHYGGTLDDLQVTSYAIPELSNFSLLTALLLLAGLFALRRSPQV